MGGHRLGRLLIRAHVDGIIDFSEVNLRDPRWHKRLALIVDEILVQDRLKSLKMLHKRRLGYLPAFANRPETFNKLAEEEQQITEDYFDLLLGKSKDKQDRKVRVAKAMRNAWNKEFGNINDEETKRKIDATVETLRQMRLARRQDK